MKRIFVVLTLAAFMAVVVAGSLAAAAAPPQEPQAASKRPQAVGPPERGIIPYEYDIDHCGNIIHVTGELRWLQRTTQPPAGAHSGSPIYSYHLVGQGTGIDSQGNEYRMVEHYSDHTITPSDPDYPYGTYTVQYYWRLVSPGQDGDDLSTLHTYHVSPNGVEHANLIQSGECSPPASASAGASASPGAATTDASVSAQ